MSIQRISYEIANSQIMPRKNAKSGLASTMFSHGTDEPTDYGRGRHGDLAAKLVAFVCLAFADAFNFRGNDLHQLNFEQILLPIFMSFFSTG